MNYLSGAFRYVARGETEPQNNVPRLIDRIKTSALPQDRRDAIKMLTEAAKTSPQQQVEVGELGLKVLYAVLEQDIDYDETIKAALDLLIVICGRLDTPQITANQSEHPEQHSEALESNKVFDEATARAAATNVDVFLGLPNALALLLQLLERGDFYVKFDTIELLTAMAANSKHTLQVAVLEAAEGVTRICELLDDNQRHIRSNVVLLLSTLCEESSEICKIIVFGGVLEKLFRLVEAVTADANSLLEGTEDEIDDEDRLEAAIIVQDVLLVVRNLISGAKTTKTFFRDSGCLNRLVAIVERTATDAGIAQNANDRIHLNTAAGLSRAIQQQALKGLNSAMECVIGLVIDDDDESKSVKNDLADTPLMKTLASIALFKESEPSEKQRQSDTILSTRIEAFHTLATLTRGHEKLRGSFSEELYEEGVGSEMSTIQALTMHAMLTDPSASIRIAAFTTLRDSFVVDSALDMPSSALLSAFAEDTVSDNTSLAGRRNTTNSAIFQARGSSASYNPTSIIASKLKEVLLGYPSVSDAAGVLYAASILTWVLRETQGGKDQLLLAKFNGHNLFPQIVRVLSRTEREKGAAEVRVSLFILLCEWLYGSSAAVSAFLASAMHLPMLMDILNSSGSRGDKAEVHSRGLAAIVLGICLHSADSSPDDKDRSSGIFRGNGSAVSIPRGAVTDLIRNRIGVTAFISCLDDLRATKSFSITELKDSPWTAAGQLARSEERNGFLCLEGSAGHEQWYSKETVNLVNDVYRIVGEKVLDLVADVNQDSALTARNATKMLAVNGHGGQEETHSTLADSTQDEVINSYKEFIRKQDISLNEANRQIEELSAALHQAQLESDNAARRNGSDISKKTSEEYEELLSQKQALEGLLEEKSADFEALSNAFAALETEHNASTLEVNAEQNDEMAANIQLLKTQSDTLKTSLDSEIRKNEALAQHARDLDDALKSKDVELSAIVSERDALKTNVHPEVVEALQWRTRAEVAESKIRSRQELIDSYQNSNAALQDQLREIERTRDEAVASVTSLTKRLQTTHADLESLRATRSFELQVSREASAASDSSAMKEISMLKEQLEDTRLTLQKEIDAKANGPSTTEYGGYGQLKSEYNAVLNAYEKTKTDLVDSKQAILQWQKRAEASEATRQRESTETKQLMGHARHLEDRVQELNDAYLSQKESADASTTRVAELEHYCKEIDEIRKHTEEELITLKEQLASRTEQSIRLSSQLYELEEAKDKLTAELENVRGIAPSMPATPTLKMDRSETQTDIGLRTVGPEIEELKAELDAMQKKLDETREALAESKDRENLSSAHASDRDDLIAKVELLENELKTSLTEKEKLCDDVNDLKERLLSLDEAEESKRALTMQVVSLQESVTALERRNASIDHGISGDQSEMIKTLESRIEQIRIQSDEKDMKVDGLQSSLQLALDRTEDAERKARDMEKQISETEAMFSVLQSERDSLTRERDMLQSELETISSTAEQDSFSLRSLQEKLTEAERVRDLILQELASLVNACKISELESKRLKDDSAELKQSLWETQRELLLIQNEREETLTRQNVDDVVKTIMQDASLKTQTSVVLKTIGDLRLERDEALAAVEGCKMELQSAQCDIAKLPVLSKERDEAINRVEEQSCRIDSLTKDLAGLKVITGERDKLESSLRLAQASIDDLQRDKSTAAISLQESQVRIQTMEQAYHEDESAEHTSENDGALRHRVHELEGALRDAAKTVTATNSELISAQSLLVELSSDKTAMRAELATAQEQISALVRQAADHSRAKQSVPALSEVSEQDQGSSEDPPVTSSITAGEESAESSLESIQAEATNLRTALERSIREADCAADIMGNIETKLVEIEGTLKDSRDSATTSQRSADRLTTELHGLREEHRLQKESFERETNRYTTKISALKSELEQAKEAWKETLSMSEESWSVERDLLRKELNESQNALDDLTSQRDALQIKYDEAVSEVSVQRESIINHEDAHIALSSSLKLAETDRSVLQEKLQEAHQKEESLKESLQKARSEMQSAKDSFEADRKNMEEQHSGELKDLEDELDRAGIAMESAERAFRDSDMALKESITQQNRNIQDLERQSRETLQSLHAAQGEMGRISDEKEQLEARLISEIRNKESHIVHLQKEKTDLSKYLTNAREECSKLRDTVTSTETMLKQTKWDLAEELEQKAVLESENHDLLTSLESLETSSKRIRSQLSEKTKNLGLLGERHRDLESKCREKDDIVKAMEAEEAKRITEIQELTEFKVKLEDEVNEIQDKLKNTEESRDSLAENNKDLLSWVSDLEKRATELQSVASDFQEVEQNLRDALESHRYSSEQNSKLVEELRKEKADKSAAQGKISRVERELGAAQIERDSSKRRVQELESRVREIRQSNLAKFSQSEEVIKAKAKQCAELETALAASERKVAELESVSDDLFGAKTNLEQLNDEMSTLRDRALTAEETGEALQKELETAQREVSEVRDQSASDALRALEAEHNELLVYLADLELEVTNLREELGRE